MSLLSRLLSLSSFRPPGRENVLEEERKREIKGAGLRGAPVRVGGAKQSQHISEKEASSNYIGLNPKGGSRFDEQKP